MTLTIRFAKSPSAYFALAQSLAAAHPSYKETKVGNQIIYEVSLTEDDIDLIEELSKLVGGWKSASITANGRKISHWDVGLAAMCREREEGKACLMKAHWCVACARYRNLKESEIQIRNAVSASEIDNVIGLPLRIPGNKERPKRRSARGRK